MDRQQRRRLLVGEHVTVSLDAIDGQQLMQGPHLRQLCTVYRAVNADEDDAEAISVTKHQDTNVDDGQVNWPELPLQLENMVDADDSMDLVVDYMLDSKLHTFAQEEEAQHENTK